MIPLRKTPAKFLQTPPPPPTPIPTPPIEPQNQAPDWVLPIEQPLQLPNALLLHPQNQPPDWVPIPNAHLEQNHFDFRTLVVAFFLTGAIEIAVQNHTVNPIRFHSLCLMVVFAFASFFVAKYIAPKHPNPARVLDHAGIFFGVTAFFLAVTISCPLCLVIISWIIYSISLLAIVICNSPRPLFPN